MATRLANILSSRHLADLRGSGLSDGAIHWAKFRTESDPNENSRTLGWDRPAQTLGSCLVIPYRDLSGGINGFARIKPNNPLVDRKTGKPRKYEQPKGAANRPYFTYGAIRVIRESLRRSTDRLFIAFTEGEKKAIRCSQAKIPCIGLTGPWGWQRKQLPNEDGTKGPRQLIDQLEEIDWNRLSVGIFYDLDDRRNHMVHFGFMELARVLHEHGAEIVFVAPLPIVSRGADGIPNKMGVDDFIVAAGEPAFRDFADSLRSDQEEISLESYRKGMGQLRLESLAVPGLYFDGSPTGTGKNFADIPPARNVKKTLIVSPSHDNCKEVVEMFTSNGLSAAAYPQLNKDSCIQYETAKRVLECGLSVSQTICQTCNYRDLCDYRRDLDRAEVVPHVMATSRRAALSMNAIALGRQYISIHEEASDVLKPVWGAREGFEQVANVVDHARGQLFAHQNAERYFLWKMGTIAGQLAEQLVTATGTGEIELPAPARSPIGLESRLWDAVQDSGIHPPGSAVAMIKMLAAGELTELSIRVDETFQPGGKKEVHRSIIAYRQTEFPVNAAVWINDATAKLEHIEALAGRPVTDGTPSGAVANQHPIHQVPVDITMRSSPERVTAALRTAMLSNLGAERVGVICHKRHVAVVKGTAKSGDLLEGELRSRIKTVEHFRGTVSRGSNSWHEAHDLLIVLGTPRIPPSAVKQRLLALGDVLAAARPESFTEWSRDYWSGVTVSGRRITVKTSNYRDHDWFAAYQSIVRAELLQCIGRARAILPEGISAVVVTNENLNCELLDFDHLITNSVLEILFAINELTQPIPTDAENKFNATYPYNIYTLGIGCVSDSFASTNEIAKSVGKSSQYVRKILSELEPSGFVQRVGKRGGWQMGEFFRTSHLQKVPPAGGGSEPKGK